MKVSIIIPTYNRLNDLKKTLSLLLLQDYDNFEIIIINNGPSTDGTDIFLKEIKDPRVKYYKTDLKGVTYARSLGNLLATGEIIIQMDDDVSLFETDTIKKTGEMFKHFEIDILGFVELKNDKEINKYLDRYKNREISEVRECDLREYQIGNIDEFYNITTGFQKVAERPLCLFKINSFRSCFMAYKQEVIKELINWDTNYIKVGSKGLIREETDFLLRARSLKKKIYYSNYSAIYHREGKRDGKLLKRKKDLKNIFYYSSAHTYMATKDLLENRGTNRLFRVLKKQFLFGSSKNPGALMVFRKTKSPIAMAVNILGFFCGLLFAIFIKRNFITDAKKYINNN